MTDDELVMRVLGAFGWPSLHGACGQACPHHFGERAVRSVLAEARRKVLQEANARAEAEMLKTHVLEGAHGRAIASLLAEAEGAA